MTLLEQLKDIRANGPDSQACGICVNISQNSSVEGDLKDVMASWPERSGDLMFPVPHPDFKDPQGAYYATEAEHMWNPEHPYGAARLRLLNWCIEQLGG